MNTKTHHKIEEKIVHIPSGNVVLEGNLAVPEDATGIVLFAHGSGSSRHSPRNRYVAEELQENALGTLLMDLLTGPEEAYDLRTGELRFDINFLARRLVDAIDWLDENDETMRLNIGLFGSSTGAAAALVAASQRTDVVKAIVSRGGRPDMAMSILSKVQAPTLLIVGGYDYPVIELNRRALDQLEVPKDMTLVAGATHLFEEPGALEEVARLAGKWFLQYL